MARLNIPKQKDKKTKKKKAKKKDKKDTEEKRTKEDQKDKESSTLMSNSFILLRCLFVSLAPL